MHTIGVEQPINLKVVRFELDFTPLAPEKPQMAKKTKEIRVPLIQHVVKKSAVPPPPKIKNCSQKKNVKELMEDLLDELYADNRDWSSNSETYYSRESTSAASVASSQFNSGEQTDAIERSFLEPLSIEELKQQESEWQARFQMTGERLGRILRARDRLRRQQKRLCAAFTVLLRHIRQMSAILNSLRNLASSSRASSAGEPGAKFGLTPSGEGTGEGGYGEWLHAMRLVARLPAGVPQHFRKKLWLTLSERHLTSRGIEWSVAERSCFRGTTQPDDTELGAQILKDLHRTGCSLFCGTEGRENQAMLRRVLLAYARWNKEVGYCQGFNMLAAIILEVMEKSESDSLKVMIYLVEAVLPEGYFADDLRGLSADMAAFRDLLRLRLPRLAHHMDHLQRISDGGGVEPPLPDVFTMQWFLTLYATWLPRESLLRVWDLVLLDGNEVLLLTALAIWDLLQDRILSARSADEFYSCMGGGAGAIWEAGESLVVRVVAFGSAPELPRLRSLHRYRVTPPAPPITAPVQPPLHNAMQSMTKRGLRLFYSEDEGDSSDDGNKMALATVIPRREERIGAGDRLSLDIGALKRQYARLRERQRQAHVILAAACARHAAVGVPTSPTSLTVNNLLLGKSAIVSSRGRRLGPPPGAVPPTRQTSSPRENIDKPPHGRLSDTISWKEEKSRKSLSRRNSVKWRDIKNEKKTDKIRKASIDLDEAGDGIIVSELEANQMIASLRSRSSSETSSYSSRSESSSDTSLCDENEKASDSEPDLPDDDREKISLPFKENTTLSPLIKKFSPVDIARSPLFEETKIKSSSEPDIELSKEQSVKNITDYLDSAAGEPLRTYLDGFESKLKENLIVNKDSDFNIKPRSPFKQLSPFSPVSSEKSDVLQRISSKKYEEYDETSRPKSLSNLSNNFADLSPLDLSSDCKCDLDIESPYMYNLDSNFKPSNSITSRPPDIIDSFTMYPNFVPDIDLSEKNISDIDSPSRSPGAESIIVSEDEPPIPLKIDKYFEHSPEFFGARVTDPNNSDIPNRRAVKRYSRFPKKPDSLTLHNTHNEKVMKAEAERASSLPQSHSFTNKKSLSPDFDCKINDVQKFTAKKFEPTKTPNNESGNHNIIEKPQIESDKMSPKDHIILSGRKNSERALQIIQENSKILNRILTKQHITDGNKITKLTDNVCFSKDTKNQKDYYDISEKTAENKQIESPFLKESTSDSVIGYRKRIVSDETVEKSDFVRVRPISIDDPFSLEIRSTICKDQAFSVKNAKSPSNECLGNKTDLYGWENKGFLAKCEYKGLDQQESKCDQDYDRKIIDISELDISSKNDLLRPVTTSKWARHSFSGESKTSITLPSTEPKDTLTHDNQFTSDDYAYPFSSKYNDFVLSKARDICSKTIDQSPKACEIFSKTDNSQVSDFAHVVTSSISFTYEPSAEDDSPTGIKSNSSDTLCQITSLDQVSTPISPKIFPKDISTFSREYIDKNEKIVVESDDTCSTITSLIDTTDTLSSFSYPRSPSSGSYHPFPTRPAMRMPKELGVRLGMYPKDSINSPTK